MAEKPPKLTPTMYRQLRQYCEDAARDGAYYGNREAFWKRHERIVAWLDSQIPLTKIIEEGEKDDAPMA